ncbi:Uncharacterized protein APZ42_021000 [Daphnia magna]|uniref:Uncharacterized protein n=1 Tax=Daphnia magna TaxID=35525 RepID=A0A164WVV1_9CRUS|nr:Uncharacterized protein APZ42_021000 [Daphnia magna]
MYLMAITLNNTYVICLFNMKGQIIKSWQQKQDEKYKLFVEVADDAHFTFKSSPSRCQKSHPTITKAKIKEQTTQQDTFR